MPRLLGISAMVAAAVVAPLAFRGWILLLDWVPGPRTEVVSGAYGGEAGIAFGAVLTSFAAATRLLGPVASWLPIAAALIVGGVGVAALTGGGKPRRLSAALLYSVNPVVFERIGAGQVMYLLGYALLPLAVRGLSSGLRRHQSGLSGLWVALLATCTIHFAWIGGLMAAAVAAASRSWRAAQWVATVGLVAAVASVYVVSPLIGRDAHAEVGFEDLEAYRTSGDSLVGLFGNVAGLYGFWRTYDVQLPKEVIPGWPVFLLAILVVAGIGGWAAWKDEANRPLIKTVVIAGVAGYFLALGDQGPTGFAYTWMFDNVPGFAVMREPQKFIALVALAYAVLFGFGVEHLVRTASGRRGAAAVMVVGIILPIAYTPTLFWGLGGQIRPSHYPDSWYEADQLMAGGDGRILFLPWHQYMSFPFTGRVIANPADNFFRRDAIVGDNVELPNIETSSTSPRSAYLEYLFDHGNDLCAFGDLVAPLGVEYVVLSHAVDWRRYDWLRSQVDLELFLESDDLTVYRNMRYRGPGFLADEPVTAAHLGEVVGLSTRGILSTRPVLVRAHEPGPIPPAVCDEALRQPPGGVSRRSLIHYEATPAEASWLIVPEPHDSGWQADGRRPELVAGGVNAYQVTGGEVDVRFRPIRWVIAGYVISALTVVGVFARVASRRRAEHIRGEYLVR